jgi:hypothetical protein
MALRDTTILLFIVLLGTTTACERGRYTGDGYYLGNPQRVPAASDTDRNPAMPYEAEGTTGQSGAVDRQP